MTLETSSIPTLAPTVPAAPVPVPTVRVGSHIDAKALRSKIQQLLAGIDRADEQVRLLCQTARERRIYLLLQGPDGTYFPDWSSFCVAPVPWGLGLDPGMLAELAKEQADPKRRARLALEAPLALGRQGVNQNHRSRQNRQGAKPTRPRLHGGEYVLQRLKRDFPHLLAKVATGELPNIKAAALAAGLARPMLTCRADPMAVARMVVSKFDLLERQEIVHLLTHPERITGPQGRDSAAWKHYKRTTMPPEEFAQREAERREATKRRAAERQRERLDARAGRSPVTAEAAA